MDPVDIVNMALQELGSAPASSFTDTAYPQHKAITQYEISRKQVLRMIEWPRVTTRAPLKQMDEQACPWAASTQYYVGDRVTNDTLKTYKCTTAGVSDSAGGPTGTSTGITDNTVVWAYVEVSTVLVNWSHTALTDYVVGDLITADTFKVYKCVTAGTTAADSAPSGITSTQTDGTVVWDYYGAPPRQNHTVYSYRYIKPFDCLRVLKIPKAAEVYETDQGEQYTLEGITIYCNRDDADLKYLFDEEEPDRWDELCQTVVALHIAQAICMNATKKKDLTILLYQKYKDQKDIALGIARQEGKEAPPEPVRWENV